MLSAYDRIFPFSWLGILSESPPLNEMTLRQSRSRLCIGKPPFAADLAALCPVQTRRRLESLAGRAALGGNCIVGWVMRARQNSRKGRIFQKVSAPVRAFVAEPMQHGRMFLAGDAAHIVPPTGAKASISRRRTFACLHSGRSNFIGPAAMTPSRSLLGICLRRIWKAVRFFQLHDQPVAPVR